MKKILNFLKESIKTKYVALAFLVMVAGGAVCAVFVTQVALPSAKNSAVKTAASVSDKAEFKAPDMELASYEVIPSDAEEPKDSDEKVTSAKVKKVSQSLKKASEETQSDGLDLNLVKAVKSPKSPKTPDDTPKVGNASGGSANGSSGAAPKKEPGRIFFGEPEDFGLEELFKEPENGGASASKALEAPKPESAPAEKAERPKSPKNLPQNQEGERAENKPFARPNLPKPIDNDEIASPRIFDGEEIERAKTPERVPTPELPRTKTPERIPTLELPWAKTPEIIVDETLDDGGHVEEDFVLDWPTEKTLSPAANADVVFTPAEVADEPADKKECGTDGASNEANVTDAQTDVKPSDVAEVLEKASEPASLDGKAVVVITDEAEPAEETPVDSELNAKEKAENAVGQTDEKSSTEALNADASKAENAPAEIVDEVLKQAAAEKEIADSKDKKEDKDEELERELAKKKAREYVAALEAEAAKKRQQEAKPTSKLSRAFNWVKDKLGSAVGSALEFIVDHKYLSGAALATALLGGTLYGASKLMGFDEKTTGTGGN